MEQQVGEAMASSDAVTCHLLFNDLLKRKRRKKKFLLLAGNVHFLKFCRLGLGSDWCWKGRGEIQTTNTPA